METNRREFIKQVGIATACTCAGITMISGCSMIKGVSDTAEIPQEYFHFSDHKLTIDLTGCDCLKPVGGAGKLSIEADEKIKILIVHYEQGEFKVFSDSCTHGGRELNYNHKEAILQCSSFGHSTFRFNDGNVIKGPAEASLKIYPAEKEDNRLVVMLG
jgi:nitrite reductase/ring-hydroxylating ferredoxin subunit